MPIHPSATATSPVFHYHSTNHPKILLPQRPLTTTRFGSSARKLCWKVRVSNDRDSYLGTWKKTVERQRKKTGFEKVVENSRTVAGEKEEKEESKEKGEVLRKRSSDFGKILEVSKEERDRVHGMQVVDRASAAIAAARAILQQGENGDSSPKEDKEGLNSERGRVKVARKEGMPAKERVFISRPRTSANGTPGPDFWSWTPPNNSHQRSNNAISKLQATRKAFTSPAATNTLMEKDRYIDFLSIPFESKLSMRDTNPLLPPLQSLLEVGKTEEPTSRDEHEFGLVFSELEAEAAHALDKVDEKTSYGVNLDGSKWWKETGTEIRPNGVLCRWTLTRGVSADEVVEWEEKYWEAADEFDYKELGSEKSGRDATGNVWREYWKESMHRDCGLLHIEKTAEKWGKNGKGDEWQEKWWEHYDASGQSEKWAHKQCSIDPNTQLDAGHAHVWHERWGEKYDGRGGSTKYTDKWAEQCEGDGWAKWGDKWDENFDQAGHGVKQGETWREGKHGERWNRTWGERHDGSGWVHKYGKSSSGEHWDTHVMQETWYERYPHYGFTHCFENSVQLREVQKPSEKS